MGAGGGSKPRARSRHLLAPCRDRSESAAETGAGAERCEQPAWRGQHSPDPPGELLPGISRRHSAPPGCHTGGGRPAQSRGLSLLREREVFEGGLSPFHATVRVGVLKARTAPLGVQE